MGRMYRASKECGVLIEDENLFMVDIIQFPSELLDLQYNSVFQYNHMTVL